jgi:hypothetical protein
MRRAGLVVAVLLGAGAPVTTAGAAETHVPEITKLRAKPPKFCARKTSACPKPGTTIRFTVSTAATVTGDIRPRSENVNGFVEFRRKFPKGANSVYLNDSRLTRGRWTLRLQGLNSVGAGPIATIDVHVARHR